MSDSSVSAEYLAEFSQAFNDHDVDKLMSMMTEDCLFEGAAGPEQYGVRFEGQEAVAAAFSAVWATFSDAHWGNGAHRVDGDFGISEWTFSGTREDGARIEADGVDLFTFKDGKIATKKAFRKDRPLLNT